MTDHVNAHLISHVDTDIMTRAQIAEIISPEATSTFKPVPHFTLLGELTEALGRAGILVESEQLAVRRDGHMLFGVMKLMYGNTTDTTAALGLRTSNDRSMSIQLCAGMNVFVCDNMAFRGDMIALTRKHTSGLNLGYELARGIDKFKEHFELMSYEVKQLQSAPLSIEHAKAIIHDVFVGGLMPMRLLPAVSAEYFAPATEQRHEEFGVRTAWSLHNAFTEVAKAMPLTTRVPAIQAVGRHFGMTNR